jgi:hypothetical protein
MAVFQTARFKGGDGKQYVFRALKDPTKVRSKSCRDA